MDTRAAVTPQAEWVRGVVERWYYETEDDFEPPKLAQLVTDLLAAMVGEEDGRVRRRERLLEEMDKRLDATRRQLATVTQERAFWMAEARRLGSTAEAS